MPKTSAHGLIEHTFSNGQLAKILKVNADTAYDHTLSSIGLEDSTSTLLVIGGASLMTPESQAKLIQFFNGPLATFSHHQNITVFDGGTDAGVIHMMGHARNHVQGQFNLVGVAPLNMVIFPGDNLANHLENPDDPPAELEPHHTHFVLVPGQTWGSESRWLAGLSETLAGSCPTMTLLINGGQISLKDMRVNLEMGRKVTVVAGSGRLADKVANTINGTMPTDDEQIQELVRTYYPKQIYVFDLLNSSLDDLQNHLKHYFQVG